MSNRQFTLGQLASLTSTQYIGDEAYLISGVNGLEDASSTDLSFLANERYREEARRSLAGVICIAEGEVPFPLRNHLLCSNPSETFQQIAKLFIAFEKESGFKGIHETAVIHPTAKIGKDVQIGPHVVIDQHVVIGDRTTIHPLVSIGAYVEIGADCLLYSHVSVREGSILKNRVILQPGAVIGSCGFGYVTDRKGNHIKLEQMGIVILEDDVEVGANTTIDRARFKATVVGKGTKLDNLIQIAHNVELGERNLFASQTGIAGSAKTGSDVYGGGQVGILGHVEITNQVLLATRSGVSKSLTKPGKYRGSPAIALHDFNRQEVYVRKLESFVKRIEALEKQLADLQAVTSEIESP